MWANHLNYVSMTKLAIRLASATPLTNFDGHNFPVADYPLTGGWQRIWVDVSRTPDDVGGTFDDTAMVEIGLANQIPNIGGNAVNMFMDSSDFTTTGLDLTGTAGLWQDFLDADEGNTTNKYGVAVSNAGIIFLLARFTLGTSSSLVFDDSGFVIIFPNQTLVATAFMGITCDLQNASTNIDWADGVIKSDGAKQGDIVVTGTSGAWDIIGMTLVNLRTIDLTSACTIADTVITDCAKINQVGATLTGLTVAGATTADGEAFIISDVLNLISGSDFTFSDGHAIEITATGTYAFTGNTFNSYLGTPGSNLTPSSGSTDAAIFNDSGGLVTINVANGDTPSIRNGAGATTVVNNNITGTITVKDQAGVAIVSAQVSVRLVSDNSEVFGGATNGSGVVTDSIPASGGAVVVRVRKGSGGGTDYIPISSPATIGASDFSVDITMTEDVLNAT